MYIIKLKNKNKFLVSTLMAIMFLFACQLQAQKKLLDQTIAVVGNQIVLQSNLTTQLDQYAQQGYSITTQTKCFVFENLLFKKLLLNQAEIDSVTVSDDQIKGELDRRIRYFIQQIGSKERLESFYDKSITQIKDEFRDLVEEQLISQQMQSQLTHDINITPIEVKKFYNDIPKDSLPLINSKVKIAQIVVFPEINKKEEEAAKDKLESIRKRIVDGENFGTMAILYSEDKGTAVKGGELGFTARAELVPKFAAVAFNLKVGEVSPLVKTKFGYHIIKLIERRGNEINVRHILIKPKSNKQDLENIKLKLDTVRKDIINGKIDFGDAAVKYSEDEATKNNEGLMMDMKTQSPEIDMDDLDSKVFFVIDKLQPGKISQPVPYESSQGKKGYRLIQLLKRTDPHKASLKQDYSFIKQAALQVKQKAVINEWIADKLKSTYVSINQKYHNCNFMNSWLKTAQ